MTECFMAPDFLTVDDVLRIHAEQITEYGGESGLLSLELLESALAQPQQTFGGQYIHDTLFSMAAAYLFHIVKNHAFVDGNKRTGLVATLVFLRINGVLFTEDAEDFYELTMGVAEGRIDKAAVAAALEALRLTGGGKAGVTETEAPETDQPSDQK